MLSIGVCIPIWYHSHIILCSIMIYFQYPSSSILLVFKLQIKIIHFKLQYPSDTMIVLYCSLLWYTFNTPLLVFYQHLILTLKLLILNLLIILYCILLKYTFNTHPLVFNSHIKIMHLNFLFKIIPFTHFLNLCTSVSCLYYKNMKYSFETVWYNIVAY